LQSLLPELNPRSATTLALHESGTKQLYQKSNASFPEKTFEIFRHKLALPFSNYSPSYNLVCA
jgi:hypothetical protein